MSETLPEDRSPEPITVESLTRDLEGLGVAAGDTVLVHGSLSALGWVCGGPPAVVDALQAVVGEDGTIVMPTHSPGNMDPADMSNPPVPEPWYDAIREQMPPYRPAVTPTQGMGEIAECFRSYPGVRRSDHPQVSFAAWGADAEFVTADHALAYSLGEQSPLARVYELGGDVLFLGTTYDSNTSFHLAEYRADLGLETRMRACAALVDGEREWVQFEDIPLDDSDFPACGAAFEHEHHDAIQAETVGVADAKRLPQPSLVDFAVEWFETNRE